MESKTRVVVCRTSIRAREEGIARALKVYIGLYTVSVKGFATDVCVPISKLPEVLLETKQDLDNSPFTGERYGYVSVTIIILHYSPYNWSRWRW